MADQYMIRCTVGSGYDASNHVEAPVNTAEPVRISNDLIDAEVWVRVRDYRGLPKGSPAKSPYFDQEPHAYNNDRYSIALRFKPKKPAGVEEAGISGDDLQFGNDFDHPIRDRLPPGFSYAMNIVKWWVDPGLDGDPYADRPYLYGPALSSFNCLHVGSGEVDPEKGGLWFEEGGSEDAEDDDDKVEGGGGGLERRRATGAPETAKERMKWALRPESKKAWQFDYGRTYCADFFNPYLDFNEFSLRLPGFTLPIMKYWDGQGLRDSSSSSSSSSASAESPKRSHALRYVLRNRTTEEVYLVVVFTLYRKDDINEDGSLKPAALAAAGAGVGGEDDQPAAVAGLDGATATKDGQHDYEEARKHFETLGVDKAPADEDDGGVD